jgi:hypothetical protein
MNPWSRNLNGNRRPLLGEGRGVGLFQQPIRLHKTQLGGVVKDLFRNSF